jgi:hypothetical protein
MFERLRNRYASRQDWPVASASLCSSEHRAGSRGDPDGYYDVVYTFWIDGHIYEGRYSSRYDLNKDDTIAIRYNPQDPNINFNPEYDFLYQNGVPLIAVLAGIVVAIAGVVFLVNR